MAFKHGLSERLDELRFPSPRSPPSESAFPGYTSLSPGHSNFGSRFSTRPTGDVRANLQRRFTTDSSKFSSWGYLNQGSGASSSTGSTQDPLDLLSSQFEKKKQHLEYMREQKRRFEEDMKILDLQHAREKLEMDQLAREMAQNGLSGTDSEPTTPPEYRETAVTSAFSRPSRFSTSSVTSSPGFFNAFAPSVMTSPQAVTHSNQHSVDRFAGHSVPGSRRNSEKDAFLSDPSSPFRPAQNGHRYSMPSGNPNGNSRNSISGLNNAAPTSGMDNWGTKYLFQTAEEKSLGHLRELERLSTPDIKSYIKLTEPDDKFPTLLRSGNSILSANPDAHDLANPRGHGNDAFSHHSRNRSSHQSLPHNIINYGQLPNHNDDYGNGNSVHARHGARHSFSSNISFHDDRHDELATPVPSSRPTALQSSYSTNDLPTVKGNGNGNGHAVTPSKVSHEHVHQHSASMGRISQGVANNRQIKTEMEEPELNSNHQTQTTLQASAAPFGPQLTSPTSNNFVPGASSQMGLPFQVPAVPSFGYGVQPYVNQVTPINGHVQNFPGAAAYNSSYPQYAPGFRFNEGAGRGGMAQRRQETDASQLTRFGNYPLEHYKGELYSLCKDQHGCRYLQRKLEERNEDHVQLIFSEVYMHVIELMTDPFGNYLCQKLLEYSNDEQRTALIDNAASQLVKIALNQHGTRALQKMIEFISTPQQTQTVINALQHHVVDLVQDLNGNHVIQKCLNRLTPEDAEFIYDAVGGNCVVVGTHRHGCCVLQRCIDHASGDQKARLIAQITSHSFALVQDPFGNYVVQYILDLNEPSFTNPLCATFGGNIPQLSKQKFSSNVIEKCLRTADNYMKREMIDEFLAGNELEKMLRDSFANYVVQTAMDFCDPDTRNRIVDAVRPILPSIRQTPHGRRIAGKIMAADGNSRSNGSSAVTSGQATPNEVSNTAQVPKAMLAKPFMYQSGPQPSGVQSPTSSGYSSNTYVPHSSQSSVSNTPSGQSDSSSVYNVPPPQQTANLGAPSQLYTYF